MRRRQGGDRSHRAPSPLTRAANQLTDTCATTTPNQAPVQDSERGEDMSRIRSAGVRRGGRALLAVAVAAVVILTSSTAVWAQSKTITLSMLAGFKEDVLRANLP